MIYPKEPIICLVGLGYVGLPLAVLFGKTELKTYGYSRSEKRINALKNNIDLSGELTKAELENTNIEYSNKPEIIKKANFIIVAVPTPVNEANVPDLTPVIQASELVGKNLKKNSIVVFESTVYPGVTEEVCVPIIEKESRLRCGEDWVIGYSPERTNPGDMVHTPDKIVKVTSGMDQESSDYIDNVYKRIIIAGTFIAKNIKTAEASKVIENTQRDINIAIMNELSMIFDRLELNTFDVLEAAGTKWNFLKFKPGLVGGHCIGVDPYYLVMKAEMEGYHSQLISAARRINDDMAAYVAAQIVKQLIKSGKEVSGSKLLIIGATFKENVKDIRNSKVADLIKELEEFGVEIYLYDPLITYDELGSEFTIKRNHYFTTIEKNSIPFDGICYAVDHADFKNISLKNLFKLCNKKPVFFDVKGRFVKDSEKSKFLYKSL